MERVFEVSPDVAVTIHQELVGDVNAVVWDSALAAIAAFIQQGSSKWEGKKVLELGAGTGACGLVLAALRAEVTLTDLPEYLPLIEKNLSLNPHLKPKATIASLDWRELDNPLLEQTFDVVLLVDCIYYSSVVPTLISLLKSIKCDEFFCIYEKRDIGEPVIAQKLFVDTCVDFNISPFESSELDPNYICDEILFLKFKK